MAATDKPARKAVKKQPMAENDFEKSLSEKAINITVWQRYLRNEPMAAEQQINHVLDKLQAGKVFCRAEIARFAAQMRNGVACPGDFSINSFGNQCRP